MRGSNRRAWIKVFITGWLHGSIRWQLDSAERGCFADLLCLAGECGKEGAICDNDGRPFPRDFIASQFHIPGELLDRTIDKSLKEGRITEHEGILTIANWKVYQSEYERQKQYRRPASPRGKGDRKGPAPQGILNPVEEDE